MATFVLVPGTGSAPADWSELVADLQGRGDRCLLVDLTPEQDHPGRCADRIAWTAQCSPTSPVLVVHKDAAAHLPGTLARFRFAAVVRLTDENPGPDQAKELSAHLAREARVAAAAATAGVRGQAPERGPGVAPPV